MPLKKHIEQSNTVNRDIIQIERRELLFLSA